MSRYYFLLILVNVGLLSALACGSSGNGIDPAILKAPISRAKFKEVDGCFYISYAKILYKYESILPWRSKFIEIPIYKGGSGVRTIDALRRAAKEKNVSILGSLCLKTRKGQNRRELLSLVKFYGTTLLKGANLEKPTIIGREGSGAWIIWYDYDYEGIPGTLMISISGIRESQFKRLSYAGQNPIFLRDIPVGESATTILYSIGIGERSPFYKSRR